MEQAAIWDIFTARCEYEPDYRDRFNRFPLPLLDHSIQEPSVSQYLWDAGFRPEYPDGKQFAVCISHDIDILMDEKWGLKRLMVNQLKSLVRGDVKGLLNNIGRATHRRLNPNYRIERTLEIGDPLGVKSTCYFLCLRPEDEDFNYSLEEIKGQFDLLTSKGMEIGLHGGHQAYNQLAVVQKEKKYLDEHARSIEGYRNHYLRFVVPDTWEILKETGFKHDATFGLAGSIGFRNGMCYPFIPFNRNTRSYIDIYELPLNVMDQSLFAYMNLDMKTAEIQCKKLIDRVKDLGGVFSLLWHNNFMQGEKGAFYQMILEYLSEQNGWFATSSELIDWWEAQGYFEEVKSLLKELETAS